MNIEFETELMYLLCRLALVDGPATKIEIDTIFRRARYMSVPEELIAAMNTALTVGGEIPVPNMELLKTEIAQTRSAARNLLAIDGVLHDTEVVAFQRLDLALSM